MKKIKKRKKTIDCVSFLEGSPGGEDKRSIDWASFLTRAPVDRSKYEKTEGKITQPMLQEYRNNHTIIPTKRKKVSMKKAIIVPRLIKDDVMLGLEKIAKALTQQFKDGVAHCHPPYINKKGIK